MSKLKGPWKFLNDMISIFAIVLGGPPYDRELWNSKVFHITVTNSLLVILMIALVAVANEGNVFIKEMDCQNRFIYDTIMIQYLKAEG
ncbi:MAG: hypothetical protein U0M15_06675 [Bacillota bacterium]|nr:hypothetical protein [Bacillota bacterium]